MEHNAQITLILKKLVFDKIAFNRIGFRVNSPLTYSLQTQISLIPADALYRVTLMIQGEKKDEYNFEISITGFFQAKDETENMGMDKVAKNASKILLPYLKNQLAVLTAQPETDCVVLPPIDIDEMLKSERA